MNEEKNKGGRPAKFKNSEELEILVDSYFNSLLDTDDQGRPYMKPATLTGLALYLGFCDRQSIYDYEKRAEFSCSIKRARLKVEEGYENALFGKHPTGAIFALKNLGWKDKQEVQYEGSVVTGSEVMEALKRKHSQ